MARSTLHSRNRTHYEVLGLSVGATATQIKHAYYRLVKLYHPDRHSHRESPPTDAHETEGHEEEIRLINAAYEVLGQPESRQAYDRQIHVSVPFPTSVPPAPNDTLADEAKTQERWIQTVYIPLNRLLQGILRSLRPQLNELAADPFDSELLESFGQYLDDSEAKFQQAQVLFRKMGNPSSLSGVATLLYYTLNHIEDALDELKYFSLNFDHRHLHTGQELFRIAQNLRMEAASALQVKQG